MKWLTLGRDLYCSSSQWRVIFKKYYGTSPQSKMATKEKKKPLVHWKVKNFVYADEPHPTIKLRCPGLSHESFDRDLKPKLSSIMITSAVARAVALHRPIRVVNQSSDAANPSGNGQTEETFLDFSRLMNDYYSFMSSSEFVMSRAMYNNDIAKWPLDLKFIHGYVGNTSVANVSHYYACSEEDETHSSDLGQSPLWTNTYQVVLIDKATRKPTQLPDWFKDKFKGRGCRDKGFIVKPFTRPALTFSLSSTVRWTDTDQYNHTNFTTYVLWAVDALHAGLRMKASDAPSGSEAADQAKALAALPSISREMLDQGLHKMQVTYMRECLEGESIETHVWQEEGGEKELVLFSVVKNGEDVCQMKMWYFPADGESSVESA
ncbi:hypothetical protein ElyMa_004684800 [Elysia marginata]|uniref:Acyl-[acyl-carrier-protein] hydrolase n=1 Tax=Elysia marginata TaxID=1093978 RepID=A0AAV4I7N7_9GAST|nr:hypothetical protein ElyMa_004684800 [Elysia marginata]